MLREERLEEVLPEWSMLFLYWRLIFGNRNILNSLSRATPIREKDKRSREKLNRGWSEISWNRNPFPGKDGEQEEVVKCVEPRVNFHFLISSKPPCPATASESPARERRPHVASQLFSIAASERGKQLGKCFMFTLHLGGRPASRACHKTGRNAAGWKRARNSCAPLSKRHLSSFNCFKTAACSHYPPRKSQLKMTL